MPAGQQDIEKAKENEAVELMKVGTKKKKPWSWQVSITLPETKIIAVFADVFTAGRPKKKRQKKMQN